MLEAGLIGSRFVHFIAVLTLFGAALFPLYTFRSHAFARDHAGLRTKLRWILLGAAVLALMSGAAWFIFTAGAMVGDLRLATDPDTLSALFEATDFGPLWAARIVVLLVTSTLLIRWHDMQPSWMLVVLSASILASLAGTGHAWAAEGPVGAAHIAADATHLLAAGMWLGGLWPLGMVIAASRKADQSALNRIAMGEILRRFSGVGTVAVAVLVMSGLVNTWFLVGTPAALLSTVYGQLLCAKLALFSFMTILATANRFLLTPKIDAFPTSRQWLDRLQIHVLGEQALGLLVVGLVAILGTLEPAVTQ